MAVKKSELYSSLWASCDELRGGMDASQYKNYVLVLLFIKYVSDKYAGKAYAAITVPAGASFADLKELKETLTQQASKMQATVMVLKQELGPGGGKMNAKAAAAVASAGASGDTHMKERNRSGRHAPY